MLTYQLKPSLSVCLSIMNSFVGGYGQSKVFFLQLGIESLADKRWRTGIRSKQRAITLMLASTMKRRTKLTSNMNWYNKKAQRSVLSKLSEFLLHPDVAEKHVLLTKTSLPTDTQHHETAHSRTPFLLFTSNSYDTIHHFNLFTIKTPISEFHHIKSSTNQLQRWQIIFLLHQSPIPLFPTKWNYHLIRIQGPPYPWCSHLSTSVVLTYKPNRFKDHKPFPLLIHPSSTSTTPIHKYPYLYIFYKKKYKSTQQTPLCRDIYSNVPLANLYMKRQTATHTKG